MRAHKSALSIAILVAISGSAFADQSTANVNQNGAFNKADSVQVSATRSSVGIEQVGQRFQLDRRIARLALLDQRQGLALGR